MIFDENGKKCAKREFEYAKSIMYIRQTEEKINLYKEYYDVLTFKERKELKKKLNKSKNIKGIVLGRIVKSK